MPSTFTIISNLYESFFLNTEIGLSLSDCLQKKSLMGLLLSKNPVRKKVNPLQNQCQNLGTLQNSHRIIE